MATITTTNDRYPQRCKGTTCNGDPCQAWAIEGSDYCFWHAPSAAAERQLAQARGGRARHGRHLETGGDLEELQLRSVGDTLAIVATAIRDTARLENSVARNRCLGYLCGVAIKAFEVSELEARMVEIERTLKLREENQR